MKQKLHFLFDSNLLVTLKIPEFKSPVDIKEFTLRKKSWCFNSGVILWFFEMLF